MPHPTTNQVTVDDSKVHGDWRDELFQNGYVVVKNAILPERCEYYIDKMFEWLESFPFGFDRNDRSTWTEQHLPTHIKGGMYPGYRIQHEKFIWEARTEDGVIEAFAKLWGTDKLLVSFDGMNFTLPSGTTLPQTKPWPHIDQSPLRQGMQCVQGVLNFAPNGPQDGGLLVVKGSTKLMPEFVKTHSGEIGRETWGPSDWFGFDESEVKWFEERGCEILKVNAEAGDLILWDSRTMHFNCVPSSQNLRAVVYACYTPASFATPDVLQKKSEFFDQRIGTTHWPHDNLFTETSHANRPEEDEGDLTKRLYEEPVETDLVLKLAGKKPY
ncbi:uncharacterized protein N7518_003451 [Penicillium psychrosexuale]|uniref:uncharacterized protein n=1 Tax=Penicillium psychrosexuale TaxID=1002107 RepID=UPI002545A663|nr:uncharacterized protein N7518_003451 [Penicillium psychrosexuale]KAJ5801383.1 hypothetical protein N7518_003451 [Penicillium psychrosexuale]